MEMTMMTTQTDYVRKLPDGGWRIGETRVSLASIVYCYWEGLSPEAIVTEFPTLTAEQVYGAIAWYLGHRSEVDQYVSRQEQEFERLRQENHAQNSELVNRLRMLKQAQTELHQP
jgi:uncharacterized protein (DUF433 family)